MFRLSARARTWLDKRTLAFAVFKVPPAIISTSQTNITLIIKLSMPRAQRNPIILGWAIMNTPEKSGNNEGV